MRVAILPRWKTIDQPQSLALIPLDFGREMWRLDHSLELTYVVPEGSLTKDIERWFRPVLAEAPAQFVEGYPVAAPRLAGSLRMKIPGCDVVLSNQPMGTMQNRRTVDVPWVQWHVWTATRPMMKSAMFWGDEDLAVETLSAVYADRNVWESRFMYEAHLATLREWLREPVVRSVVEKSTVIPNGVKVEGSELPKISRRRPTVVWTGNPNVATKRFDRSIAVLKRVQAATGCRVLVISPTDVPENPFDTVSNASRRQFLDLIGEADVFVCNSTIETYGVAYLEMMAAGVVGVFERAWWNDTLIPETYPWVGRNEDDQIAMVTALLRNWPHGMFEHHRQSARRFVEREHSLKVSAEKLLEELRTVIG